MGSPVRLMVQAGNKAAGQSMFVRVVQVAVRLCYLAACAIMLGSCAGGTGDLLQLPSLINEKKTAKLKRGDRTKSEVYRLGAGDKLQVTVEGVKEHSGQFNVGGDGAVSLPFVGNIKAAGLTLSQFRTRLKKSLKGIVRNPQVRVSVLNYRPFYIQGEVRKSGQYEFREGLDARRAIAIAGGYTYRAIKHYVLIEQAGQSKEQKYTLNEPVFIRPGDVIRIPERFF